MDGLLPDVADRQPEEFDGGVALSTELGRWPGGRALYYPGWEELRTPGPGANFGRARVPSPGTRSTIGT
ncbi:hypothetical protein [Streptomyces sp. NPDC057696]|uniref:hypothetical protein n=1 Tax=Streptomyces sp. NPDC057696 TaxID=3346218 RepID=UPI00368A6831